MTTTDRGRAVVLGAGCEPGTSIALALGRAGWPLLLQDEGGYRARLSLARRFRAAVDVKWVAAELYMGDGRDAFFRHLASQLPVGVIVLTAGAFDCGAPGDGAEACFRVMKELGDIAQVSTGSAPRWISVVSCNSMPGAEAELPIVHNMMFGSSGRSGKSSLPISTLSVSRELVAGEIAEAVIQLIDAPQADYELDPGQPVRLASRGHSSDSAPAGEPKAEPGLSSRPAVTDGSENHVDSTATDAIEQDLSVLLRRILRLDQSYPLGTAGLSVTPGWDSLKQIEIILAVEKSFGFRFRADEIAAVKTFRALVNKISTRTHGNS